MRVNVFRGIKFSLVQTSKIRTISTSLLLSPAADMDNKKDRKDWKKTFTESQPVILRNHASDWPAIGLGDRQWSNLQRLSHRPSRKALVVRAEVGKNYLGPCISLGGVYSLYFILLNF